MLNSDEIKNILIIGSGTLGLRIGLRCAIDGYNVRMYDVSESALQKAQAIQTKILQSYLKKGVINDDELNATLGRIQSTTNKHEAVQDIHLVSESVTEDLEIKRKTYAEFAPLFESRTVVTTNTSYLLPSMFAEITGCPERFCAWHFHDVFTMNVVDIMPHTHTSDWVIDLLMDLSKRIRQIPVLIQNENPGYIFNQMLLSLLGSAGDLLSRNVATIQDIDKSWMGNTKMNIGPFGIMDQIGLDTAWHVTNGRTDSRSIRFAELLKQYLDKGKLGVKTGEGFYQYPHPDYQKEGFIE